MNVAELIEELQKLDQSALVILQQDSEGNGYSPSAGVEECWYEADTTWSGEIVEVENEDDVEGLQKAVVLWPTN